MLKYILFISINISLLNPAKCKNADTTIIFLKNSPIGFYQVKTLDSADFFRVMLPIDPDGNTLDVKEFYKNGKPKFIGKYLSGHVKVGAEKLSGDCITFYQNGKRQSISHYTDGEKDGMEYLSYPAGGTYQITKLIPRTPGLSPKPLKWDCFHSKGKMISKEGNGQWIIYDDLFENVRLQGAVKNGLEEGDWRGKAALNGDSINYTYKYYKGELVSSIGYDKKGTAYPFVNNGEMANYEGGIITFIRVFKSHLKLPKDVNNKKMSIDTVHISFIVEKDGGLTDCKTLGNVSNELNLALSSAMAKCKAWYPSRYYGIPLRTEIVLPLTFLHEYTDYEGFSIYEKKTPFKEKIIGF